MTCQLTLISSSAGPREPADCDLVFHLDETQLPNFCVAEIWRKHIGNPLRDRLMIKWLFSDPIAQQKLDHILSKINHEIERHLPTSRGNQSQQDNADQPFAEATLQPSLQEATSVSQPSSPNPGLQDTPEEVVAKDPHSDKTSNLVVRITCRKGTHYSPCFVERLRDIYQNHSVYNKELIIQTQHWCVFTRSREKKDAFAWQWAKFPTMYIQNVEILTNNHIWVPFQTQTSKDLEQSFRSDPYCSVCTTGTSSVVDFESGTLFDKRKRKTFFIRSTVVPFKNEQAIVRCRLVGDEAYKQSVKRYDGAGILFYSVHPVTGEAMFLLGHMTYGCQSWCDFGGLKSWKKFKEKSRQTAARECYEETLGILGSASVLQRQLEDFKTNNVFKVVNEVYYYVSHFLRVPFRDYPKLFNAAALRDENGLEIDEIRWFSLTAIREAVGRALNNHRVMVVSHTLKDGTPSPETNRLRLEFVHTMCIAAKLGILDSIDYITKHLNISNQQPPPKPVSYPKPRSTTSKADHVPDNNKDLSAATTTRVENPMKEREQIHTSNEDIPVPNLESTHKPDPSIPTTHTHCSSSELTVTSSLSSDSHTHDTLQDLSATSQPETDSLTKEVDLIGHRCHPSEQMQKVDASSPRCQESEDIVGETETDDLETRSRAWSFEAFIASLPSKQTDEDMEKSPREDSLFGKLRQRKTTSSKKRSKSKSPAAVTMINGKPVLYYGMGAGTFGV